MDILRASLVLFIGIYFMSGCVDAAYFNVMRYGAAGNGKKDDSEAFLKAWEDTCGAEEPSVMVIPSGRTFLVKPMTFSGPCNSGSTYIQIFGKVIAPEMSSWNDDDDKSWLVFDSINGLTIHGPGQIDGRGSSWWKCRMDHKCSRAPTAFVANNCNHLKIIGVYFVDAPMFHIVINGCDRVAISNIHITAPEESMNTDGIHVGNSRNVYIDHSIIATGDDCISIGDNSSYVFISEITCGPGHGISIGSLGADKSSAAVEMIRVSHCTFIKTMNGARIKTWQGGSGYARNIKFENIYFDSVDNPIIIDQYYCNGDHNCGTHKSAVKVSDVIFKGLRGTSTKEVAINLACSKTVGCTDITLEHIQVKHIEREKNTISNCINAHGISQGPVSPPVPCLS
ncbi:hypothetical protein MKW98_013917 [Papaver atlanticum]|uniref:endo-polygalacturonase n=1 Tax=Papaver atlanticum TaxID=357466 RepID=A0AAD4XCR4_9MAGN|nr:hypothetical protein MKW98_013917 [Papaver atlanticum]